MSTNWLDETPEEERRRRFWNTAPADPVRLAQKSGVAHYNRPLGRVLMPQSLMPVGPHRQMTLERVPLEYLLWVQAQPWAAAWHAWQPVADYLSRHPVTDAALAALGPRPWWPEPVIFAGPVQPCTPGPGWRWDRFAELTCTPGHEDKLATFALGALDLPAAAYIQPRGSRPHVRLTLQKRHTAITLGAHEVHTARQAHQHFQRVRESGTITCTKHCYPDKQAAETEINRVLKNPRRNRHHAQRPDYLRAYECPECRFWHLTKQPPR